MTKPRNSNGNSGHHALKTGLRLYTLEVVLAEGPVSEEFLERQPRRFAHHRDPRRPDAPGTPRGRPRRLRPGRRPTLLLYLGAGRKRDGKELRPASTVGELNLSRRPPPALSLRPRRRLDARRQGGGGRRSRPRRQVPAGGAARWAKARRNTPTGARRRGQGGGAGPPAGRRGGREPAYRRNAPEGGGIRQGHRGVHARHRGQPEGGRRVRGPGAGVPGAGGQDERRPRELRAATEAEVLHQGSGGVR